ncbi:sensor histidine kinase [Arenimonas oryziterrae]|uniref:Signal transduction histidine kinase internal region domain-containing protein n=1 Tax=Arenimonas oryziterrae DSM 21050 = YC6267 TaxID=1121015 RepID=A0A091BI66_9GAMM|nr:histidine kinase [Arenimonas oryziterrae]KFN44050.1 hypothetical protein N789_06445 [Arenimonas oryziterrae DSM 21050 = YC6267]
MAAALRRPWLPDFCSIPRIAAVIGIAELVVLIIAIAPTRAGHWNLEEFASASALAIWLSLTVAILYCKGAPLLNRLPTPLGVAAALSIPLLISGFVAWTLMQIDLGLGELYRVPGDSQWRFVASVTALSVLIAMLSLRYFYVRDQWQAQVNAQAQAEVDALQARIRPHFLFNSMNTIAALVRRDPVTAERAVEDLSELFRAALGAGQGEGTLAEEIHLAERYLAIEKLRLGERLKVDWQIDPAVPRDLRLPRLVLQPLLENAVLHGISRLPAGGEIRILMKVADRRLQMLVVNPTLAPNPREAGNGHAQESIAQRLAFHFGPAARMTTAYADGYYVSDIGLPLP